MLISIVVIIIPAWDTVRDRGVKRTGAGHLEIHYSLTCRWSPPNTTEVFPIGLFFKRSVLI